MSPSIDKSLTHQDFLDAAILLNCKVAAIRAVDEVESNGSGFLEESGRPKILFEGHYFSRFTKHRYDKSHPTISYPKWTKKYYLGGEKEYIRLDSAVQLDREAALKSASWGRFQIMGDNHFKAGFTSVQAFVNAIWIGTERHHLIAFCNYVENALLDDELRNLDWKGFALGYNGRLYWKNSYDKRLAASFKKFSKGN